MIITLDVETYKWNEKKKMYVPGFDYPALITDTCDENMNHRTFENNNKLWEYLIMKGKKEKKFKRLLTVYAHNAQFDFYKIITERYMKNITIHSNRPFIASYMIDGKEVIKFLDTMGIFSMSLKKVGKIVGLNKKEMPEEQLKNKPKFQQLRILTKYCERDTEIIIKGIKKVKEMVRNNGVIIRRYVTISQIANTLMLNKMSKIFKGRDKNPMFYDNDRRYTHKSEYNEEIRKAYRGGKCEAYKLGKYDNVTTIDINSLYTWSAMEMRFPNLNTEKRLKNPDKYGLEFLNKIGISKVMIKNKSDEYGFIGVRTGTDNHYLRPGQKAIGTWTNTELKYALNNGYKLIKCEWSIVYEKAKINPYRKILPNLYKKKKNSKTEFEKFFYKAMMNHSFGKLGQYRPYTKFKIDDIEKAEEYLKKNYQMVAGHGYKRVFKKEGKINTKPYYAPLIIMHITALGRIKLHKETKKIPIEDVLYSDTDSIIFKNDHLDKFKISRKLGEWKIEHENETIYIRGRKTYMMGDSIKVSGFYKSDLDKESFLDGYIESKKMQTIKTTPDMDKWGTFKKNHRNLNEQQKNTEYKKEKFEKEPLLIDNEEEEINDFLEMIGEQYIQCIYVV